MFLTFQLAFQIKDCLQRATLHSNSQVGTIFHEMDTIKSPPTYFRTDKFTNAFQEIVDAYGYVHSFKTLHDGWFYSVIYLGLFSSCLVLIIITECYQIN